MNNFQDDPANTENRKRQIIQTTLCFLPTSISYYASQELAETYPHQALVKGFDPTFDAEAFVRSGLCTKLPSIPIHNYRDSVGIKETMGFKFYQTMNEGSL